MAASLPEPHGFELNPAQQKTLDLLRRRPGEEVACDDGIGDRLRRHLEGELSGPGSAIPDGTTLFVNKYALAGVHGCEARWQAEDETDFEVTAPKVVGSVAHKAIELKLNRRADEESEPGDLVDSAMRRLAGSDRWMGDWLEKCDPDDRAEVRGDAVARVAAFDELWPPLENKWRPVTEATVRHDLLGRRISLGGKIDLSLGHAKGSVPRKVVVDLKTGRFNLHHRDDLRFYALVETLKFGVPPRALATSYLDSGELHVEAVTEETLETAAARTVDGVERIVALRFHGDEPVRRPSGLCRYCPLVDGCDPGQRHLEHDAHTD